MRVYLLIFITCLISFTLLNGQTRSELEKQRKKTLSEISYVDNLLKTTGKKKAQSMNAVKIISNKLNLRESVLKSMSEEIGLINSRISLNKIAIDMMEEDLIALKNEYAQAVYNSYKVKKGNPELVYILSARDFNQGYKRLKYLQQITKYRRRQSEIILELKGQSETSKQRLENDLSKISDLKTNEEQQKKLLQNEKDKRKGIVRSLSSKERQLKQELKRKKSVAKKIEKEIAKIIEEERKKAIKSKNTPEQQLIGKSFVENKGRLPWPVVKGIITSKFGIHQHPVLKNLTEDNIGIEITSSERMKVRSVFKGQVVKVFSIAGANMTIIIRHGKYLTVYANIINVKVRSGENVEVKQELGNVYSDPGSNNNCVLKFMIFEKKYLNPKEWISKN
jgi:murein hydrolase activator